MRDAKAILNVTTLSDARAINPKSTLEQRHSFQ